MRAYHDPEGLAKIGLPAENKNETRAGFKICFGFCSEFGDEIESFPRHVIDENDLNGRQPDVVFHERGNPIAVVIIEIDDKKKFKRCKDVVRGHLESYPDVHEGFAYNIEDDIWVRFYREDDDILQEKSSESEYLGCNFAHYL